MTEGPLRVVSVTDTKVVVRIEQEQERLSSDRLVKALLTADLLRRKALQNKDNKDRTESAAKGARTNENDMPNDKKYVIEKIVDHSDDDRRWMFRVRWYGFSSADDARKPMEGLPRGSVMRCLRKVRKVEWSSQEILDKIEVE